MLEINRRTELAQLAIGNRELKLVNIIGLEK
jgi:hypothetical protein